MHRESSVFTTMFGLLFWDLIYKEGLPDTFISEYQHQPLDFQTDLFYETRKEDIDLRLQTIRSFKSQVPLCVCATCKPYSFRKSLIEAN